RTDFGMASPSLTKWLISARRFSAEAIWIWFCGATSFCTTSVDRPGMTKAPAVRTRAAAMPRRRSVLACISISLRRRTATKISNHVHSQTLDFSGRGRSVKSRARRKIQCAVDGMNRYWQQSLAEISQRIGKIAGCPCHIVAAAMTGNGLKAGFEQQRILILDAGNQPQRQAFLA